MKTNTGMLELVVMLSLMVASIPLLLGLVRTCNITGYTYLQDKSLLSKVYFEKVVFQDENGIEWTYNEADGKYYGDNGGVRTTPPANSDVYYVSEDISILTLNKAAVNAMPYIQDDYCPDNGERAGEVQSFYLDANKSEYPNKDYLDFRDTTKVATPGFGSSNWVSIKRGWKSYRESETKDYSNVLAATGFSKDKELYLVWDAANSVWVITPINWRIAY